jgi:hypothetical protein
MRELCGFILDVNLLKTVLKQGFPDKLSVVVSSQLLRQREEHAAGRDLLIEPHVNRFLCSVQLREGLERLLRRKVGSRLVDVVEIVEREKSLRELFLGEAVRNRQALDDRGTTEIFALRGVGGLARSVGFGNDFEFYLAIVAADQPRANPVIGLPGDLSWGNVLRYREVDLTLANQIFRLVFYVKEVCPSLSVPILPGKCGINVV